MFLVVCRALSSCGGISFWLSGHFGLISHTQHLCISWSRFSALIATLLLLQLSSWERGYYVSINSNHLFKYTCILLSSFFIIIAKVTTLVMNNFKVGLDLLTLLYFFFNVLGSIFWLENSNIISMVIKTGKKWKVYIKTFNGDSTEVMYSNRDFCTRHWKHFFVVIVK